MEVVFRIKVSSRDERRNIIAALVENGYIVRVVAEEIASSFLTEYEYFIEILKEKEDINEDC